MHCTLFHASRAVQVFSLIKRLLFSLPLSIYNLLQHFFFIIVSSTVSCWRSIHPCIKVFLLICPQEHFNYYTMDAALGHLVFSMKYDVIGDQEHLRLMLRYNFLLSLSLTCFLSHLCFFSPPSLLLNHTPLLCNMPCNLSLPLLHFPFLCFSFSVSLSPWLFSHIEPATTLASCHAVNFSICSQVSQTEPFHIEYFHT